MLESIKLIKLNNNLSTKKHLDKNNKNAVLNNNSLSNNSLNNKTSSYKQNFQPSYKSSFQSNLQLNFQSSFKGSFQSELQSGFFPAQKLNFNQTLEDNYFQLPKVTLVNGEEYQLKPDKSQLECAKKLFEGDSVVFCAPTGTGKTAVAHYAITKNLKDNKRTIYTTPLVALANDKLREFQKIYGKDNVGLLTGENKINTNAPIQIMTTEIFNNQIPALNPNSIGTVIFDEVHYIGSYDRGNVWENSIINASNKNIQLLALSATVGNSKELGSWIQKINHARAVSKVELDPTERFVPLVWHIHQPNDKHQGAKDKSGAFKNIEKYEIDLALIDSKNLSDKQRRAMEIIYRAENNLADNAIIPEESFNAKQTLAQQLIDNFVNETQCEVFDDVDFKIFLEKFYPGLSKEKIEEITQLLIDRSSREVVRFEQFHKDDDYPSLIEDLKRENLLPALIFKLSRSQTKKVIESLKEQKVDLTTKEEKEEIQRILEEYKEKNIYLGTNFDKETILKGYAYHHAGQLPQYRKLIEELFSRKLLKVVSATSTLSAGINMPAKTVVVSDSAYQKFNPLTEEMESIPLNASEFHQMAGRAGRRGIDNLGHVVLYNLKTAPKTLNVKTKNNNIDNEVKKKTDELKLAYELLESDSNDLKSSFGPDWVLLSQYYQNNQTDKGLEDLINKSFRMHLAQDNKETLKNLSKNFKKYKQTLEKLQFIETDKKGITSLTPKGEILTKSQGINSLLLAGLIYDEKLKNIDIFDLCQIVGYIASSNVQEDDCELMDIIKDRFDLFIEGNNKKQEYNRFEQIQKQIKAYETTILRREYESRVSKDKILKMDIFGGFAVYAWSKMNDNNPNSINNFRAITGTIDKALTAEDIRRHGEISALYNRKALEGNLYKTLSQSVSILKQIDKICDYAIGNPQKFSNTQYYEKLKETAQLALILVKQNPIYDEENFMNLTIK